MINPRRWLVGSAALALAGTAAGALAPPYAALLVAAAASAAAATVITRFAPTPAEPAQSDGDRH